MEKGLDTSPNELLKRLASGTSLRIGRVPKPTLIEFRDWAASNFEDDYGMALKHLWDVYKGLMPPPESQIKLAMEEFNARLDAVEARSQQPEQENAITLGDGRKIRRETK